MPRLPDRRLSEGRRLARLAEPLGPGRSDVTSQGHPRAIFRRVLERETLLVAEATAKEIGRLSLDEALELTLLIARRHPRVAGLSYRPRFTFMKGL